MSPASEGREKNRPENPARPWLLPALIVLAALAAHGGCLGSTFYLDDWTQIVANDGVDGGQWWAVPTRALTYLTYWLTYRVFGLSAPVFHAGNLLLHAGVALAVYGFAREFFAGAVALPPERARRVAFWAGVLFAVHPLCSEVPNYTRARDIELVSLFAVLAARATLRWRRSGDGRWLAAAMAAVLAATFSKEVGVVVAGGTAILVAGGVPAPAGCPRWTWPRLRGRSPPVPPAFWLAGALATCVVFGLAVPAYHFFYPLGCTVWQSLHNPRLPWHLLTEARVFWMYAWRVALPIRLCSDHQVAWTVSSADRVAWGSAAALAAALAGTVCLWLRAPTRPPALLLALAFLSILHRLGNVSGELMVEYRMYPAMMFLCPALSWGLDAGLARAVAAPLRPGWLTLLATVLATLSALRTRDWRSPETLAANVVAQYPLQARARQEAQEADIRAGRWESVLARQDGIRPALDAMNAFNQSQNLRRYDPGLATLTRVSSEGNYALGLAHTGRPRAGFEHLVWIMDRLRDNHATDPIYWSCVYLARGMFHEFTGQDDDAELDLRDSRDLSPWFNVPQRELRKLQARRKK